MQLFKLSIIGGCLLLLSSTTSYAQSIDDATLQSIQNSQEQTLIRQQKQLDEIKRLQKKREFSQKKELKVPSRPAPKPIPKKLSTFLIQTITLDGSHRMGRLDRGILLAPYINKDLDLNEINKLIHSVTNWYINRGFVTTRVYLPKQNLQDGHLSIQIVEGKIETIRFVTDPDQNTLRTITAFPFMEGQVLNLKDLETSLSRINQRPSTKATLDFVPVKGKLGYTHVQIKTEELPQERLSIRYDNSALKPLKLYPNSLTLSKDNLLNMNDGWTVVFSQTNDDTAQNNNSQSVSLSLPFGRWSASLSTSRFEYMTLIDGTFGVIKSSGLSDTHQAQLTYLATDRDGHNLSFNSGLTIKDTENYIEDALQDVSSRKLVLGTIGGSYTLTTPHWGIWSFATTYTRSLDLDDAAKDATDITLSESHAQFEKTTIDLGLTIPKHIIPFQIFNWSSQLHAQSTPVTLFTGEQMSIGDLYSVRGFRSQSIQGDIGIRLRNEASVPMTQTPGDGSKWFDGASLYTAADIGYVRARTEAPEDSSEGILAGGAIGIRKNVLKGISYDVTLTFPFAKPSSIDYTGSQVYWQITKSL
ncbi:ShlB/FhaC/HecB family hemolysin secretion/activation protein [bacterium]|nr:ShlB/FhaC/HecB family hemolysin secretion/activation protein [bacterium]